MKKESKKAVKLAEVEIAKIKELQEKRNNILVELGRLELVKLELKSRRESIEEYIKKVNEEEAALSSAIETLYGKGSINMETGEITPLEAE